MRVLVGDSNGNRTAIVHNAAGHVVLSKDASGLVSENVYGPDGQLIYSSGAPGAAVESQIFNSQNRTLTSIAGGRKTATQYDETGFPVRRVDPDGRVSEYSYVRGLLRRHKTAGGAVWEFDYDERGELRRLSMPHGRVIHRDVAADYSTETFADDYGMMEALKYDEFGRVVQSADSAGLVTQFRYGDRDQVTTVLLPDSTHITYEYDAEGNLIRETNEIGQQTEYTFTPFGHLTSTSRSGDWRLSREYDTEDNLIAVRSPAGALATMDYDPRGQMVRLQSFDGRVTHFAYDGQGRLVSAVELPSRNRITFLYGDGLEVRRTVYSDGSFIDCDYAEDGDLISLANESCRLTFTMDSDGRLVREERDEGKVEYTYDEAGNVESVASDWGAGATYRWDLRGRLTEASIGNSRPYRFEYDGRDLLVSCVWPNGLSEALEYDAMDRLIRTQLHDRSGAEIHRLTYTYDPVGRLTRTLRDDGLSLEYVYDELDRVTHVYKNGALTEFYKYDLDGNLLLLRDGTSLDVAPGGRVRVRGNHRSVNYDESGRIAEQEVDGLRQTYRYNAVGQLIEISANGQTMSRFTYDPLGRRLTKKSPDRSSEYLWTGLAPLTERTSSGMVNYLFLPGSFFLKASSDDGDQFGFVLDHLGSPVVGVGSDQQVVEMERTLWAEVATTPTVATLPQIGRLGQYWDADSRLHYNWHRYYDPSLARYLQPDPLDLAGGLNLYAYPEQPLAWVDPFGLYVCRIKMNECWNADQEKDARKKLERLNEKKKENRNRRKPGRCTFQTAAERWKYCKDKNRLTADQLKEKRQFRLPCKVQHVDHILEKQLRGGDDCDNLQALNAKVNMSFGAQIFRCRKRAGFRTPSSFQFYKTQRIPCKPGEEC
jgi:RHS repeat-associated protein